MGDFVKYHVLWSMGTLIKRSFCIRQKFANFGGILPNATRYWICPTHEYESGLSESRETLICTVFICAPALPSVLEHDRQYFEPNTSSIGELSSKGWVEFSEMYPILRPNPL